MPVCSLDKLEPGEAGRDKSKLPVNVENADRLAISACCRYSPDANGTLRIHVLSGNDGKEFDTSDLRCFDLDLKPGNKVRQTFESDVSSRFIKIVCENCDKENDIEDIFISIVLKK